MGKYSVIFVLLYLSLSSSESFTFSRLKRTLYSNDPPGHFIVDTKSRDQMFKVYWNVPTFQCRNRGIVFKDLATSYGIRQNENDNFRGEEIVILYDPGNFPALLHNPDSEVLTRRNGGVPQEGNLTKHLEQFNEHLDQLIPNGAFNGIGVIDFESWRPIFRQNFGTLQPYKDLSYQIERERHFFWPQSWIESEATDRFERSGVDYMKETLIAAKEARPLAKWGYYAYPYCFNMNAKKNVNCDDNVKGENDRIMWLWDESDALFPSVYLRKSLTPDERMKLIKGRINEAKRLSKKSKTNPPIYLYIWYKYQDSTNEFLTKDDLYNALKLMRLSGVNGAIIWGSSNDVNNKGNCLALDDYVKNVLGPIVKEFVPVKSKAGDFEFNLDIRK